MNQSNIDVYIDERNNLVIILPNKTLVVADSYVWSGGDLESAITAVTGKPAKRKDPKNIRVTIDKKALFTDERDL